MTRGLSFSAVLTLTLLVIIHSVVDVVICDEASDLLEDQLAMETSDEGQRLPKGLFGFNLWPKDNIMQELSHIHTRVVPPPPHKTLVKKSSQKRPLPPSMRKKRPPPHMVKRPPDNFLNILEGIFGSKKPQQGHFMRRKDTMRPKRPKKKSTISKKTKKIIKATPSGPKATEPTKTTTKRPIKSTFPTFSSFKATANFPDFKEKTKMSNELEDMVKATDFSLGDFKMPTEDFEQDTTFNLADLEMPTRAFELPEPAKLVQQIEPKSIGENLHQYLSFVVHLMTDSVAERI